MARNRIVNKLKSRIPYLGNNQALKNHIANALRNAGDLNVVIKNIDAIPKENMDSLTKTGLEKFKNEIIPEIRQIIKETQGETAEQGSKIEQAGAKQGNKTVVRGNNIQIIENLDEAEIRDIITNKKRVAVDMLDKETADKMGFKYPDVKRTIYADEITHTLKQHGNEAKEAARGQKAITAKDIANYHKFAKDADKNIIVDGERGQKVLISGKQINGHYVIVEEAQTKNNNLAFKTMYFRKGNVNDNKVFQSAPMAKDSQGLAFSPYKDDAQRVAQTNDSIIPQNSAKDELKSLSKEYDVEQFLKDREDILAKDARYGKTRFSESRIEDNGGVGGWEYKRTPAGYDKNYNADFLITKADVAKIRGGKIDEQGSKIEQARVKREVVKGEAPGQHPDANFANEKIINQPGLRLNKSREKLIKNTDVSKLNDEQKSVYDVFIGERDKVILQGKDLSDLYALEQGGKNAGAKKIMIKHAGIEKTGGLSNDELLNIMDVVRNGKIADDSFELRDDIIRYAYDLKK